LLPHFAGNQETVIPKKENSEMSMKTKRVVLTVCLWALMCCATTIAAAQMSPSFEPLPASKIDQAQKDKASQIATTTLNNWFKGQFAPLSDDFSQQMKDNLGAEAQKQATEALIAQLGDFQSLEFAEAVTTASMPGIVVYRLKGKFSKAPAPADVRVVFDKQGKVAGFWVKPWQDKMQ
jgi:hypothetical protein